MQGFRHRELADELILDQQVREVFTNDRAVLVADGERSLLLRFEAELAQTMDQRVIVNLLQMAAAVVAMNLEAGIH